MKNALYIIIISFLFGYILNAQDDDAKAALSRLGDYLKKAESFAATNSDSCLYYVKEIRKVAPKGTDAEAASYLYESQVYVALAKEKTKKRNYKDALKNYQLADNTFAKFKANPEIVVATKIGKADIFTKTGKGYDALNELNEALVIAQNEKKPALILAVQEQKIETFSISNRFKDAFKLQSSILDTKDSIFNEIKKQQIADIAAKYKISQQETAAALARAEKAEKKLLLKEESESSRKTHELMTNLGIGLVGLLGIAFMFFRNMRLRSTKNKLIEEKRLHIEEKNNWLATEKIYVELGEKALNRKNAELHKRNELLKNKEQATNTDTEVTLADSNNFNILGNSLNADKIICISVDPEQVNNKIILMEDNETLGLKINKTELVASLPSATFEQVNRSQIINLRQVKRRKNNNLIMSNNDEISIDKKFLSKIEKKLSALS